MDDSEFRQMQDHVSVSSPIVRGGLGQCCHVCVIHLGTVRTLLVLSYGSATELGFECGLDAVPNLLTYTEP
jgi:hypothetical protein